MEPTFYRQCQLTSGSTSQVAWLPERFAVSGKRVVLYGDMLASGPWTVSSVSASRRPECEAMERKDDHRYQRAASDI